MTTQQSCPIHQLHINNAFLEGRCDEEVSMHQWPTLMFLRIRRMFASCTKIYMASNRLLVTAMVNSEITWSLWDFLNSNIIFHCSSCIIPCLLFVFWYTLMK